MYEGIKKNIIERFFNTHYRWTCNVNKENIINDMRSRLPFDIDLLDDENEINMNIGDGIVLNFKLNWEAQNRKTTSGKEYVAYRLTKIS